MGDMPTLPILLRSLDVDVEDGQGEQHGTDPGDGVDGDNEWFNHPEHVGQEDIEDEGEAVIHCAQVTAEPVKNLTEGSHIKEFFLLFITVFNSFKWIVLEMQLSN